MWHNKKVTKVIDTLQLLYIIYYIDIQYMSHKKSGKIV